MDDQEKAILIPKLLEVQRIMRQESLLHKQRLEILEEVCRSAGAIEALNQRYQMLAECDQAAESESDVNKLLVGSVSALCGDELVSGINIISAVSTLRREVTLTDKSVEPGKAHGVYIAANCQHAIAICQVLEHLIECAKVIKKDHEKDA